MNTIPLGETGSFLLSNRLKIKRDPGPPNEFLDVEFQSHKLTRARSVRVRLDACARRFDDKPLQTYFMIIGVGDSYYY